MEIPEPPPAPASPKTPKTVQPPIHKAMDQVACDSMGDMGDCVKLVAECFFWLKQSHSVW